MSLLIEQAIESSERYFAIPEFDFDFESAENLYKDELLEWEEQKNEEFRKHCDHKRVEFKKHTKLMKALIKQMKDSRDK